ncbi:MAG: glycosyltransferase family 4 protein [Planctomycetes bacterium]|nr:glycosyltransferase family 4 protein [Planctomycetota bacterium]
MSAAPTVPWPGHPRALAPLAAIRAARKAGAAEVVDDTGRPVPFGPARFAYEALRTAWHTLLRGSLAGFARLCTGRRAPAVQPAQPGSGPVVLVLPVLPDLSHTFVYREVLAVLRRRPDWRVVVLARNDAAPRHAEAEALAGRATWLGRDGVTRAWWRACTWLLRRRGRAFVTLFRAEGGGPGELFGKLPLRDPRHPGNAFLLADLLRPLRPRHVHVYASTWPANVALGASMLLGAPFSISSYVDFEFPYSHRWLATKVARATFFRVVTACCQARLCARPELATNPPPAARVPVIYLGLDLDHWRDEVAPPGRGVLVSAARLVPKKGLQFVPPALAVLRRRGVACRWRVLGDGPGLGPLRADCQRLGVADLVDFLGPVDSGTVRQELLRADLAVLPCIVADDGERDGIPIFLVEAMALGVPVVTTPISGIPELIVDGDTGFLAAPGSADALAQTLTRALQDPAAAGIGRRGRAAVHARLDVDDAARQLVEAIER